MIRSRHVPTAALLGAATLLFGCPTPQPPAVDSILPEDYLDTYTEVRDCRSSGDHDLHNVRVLADPAALEAYRDRAAPFPVGSIVVKEEFDFGDADCTGPVVRWTVMQREEPGTAPAFLDWYWQSLDEDGVVDEDNSILCANCHMGCDPPIGYEGTCTSP